MAAKVLLGVVALAAIVGSPIAYNHLSSSSGETQKEKEAPRSEEANVAQEDRQDTNEKVSLPENVPAAREEVRERDEDVSRDKDPLQADAPAKDDCNIRGTGSWNDLGTLDPKMHCVRDKIKESRESH